jgi:hypothetical protein
MFGQPTAIKSGFLTRSHGPVGPLACPARFERATYALEWLTNLRDTRPDNSIQRAGSRFGASTGRLDVRWRLTWADHIRKYSWGELSLFSYFSSTIIYINDFEPIKKLQKKYYWAFGISLHR